MKIVMEVPSGGGTAQVYQDDFTFSSSATSHTFTTDFEIKYALVICANSSQYGFLTVFLDASSQSEYKMFWNFATQRYDTAVTNNAFTVSGKNFTMTAPNTNWYYKTKVYLFG